MKEKNTSTESASTVCYATMEAHARQRIQVWLQDLLEAEVSEFLGRAKSQRRGADTVGGYRNGYGKPRRVALRPVARATAGGGVLGVALALDGFTWQAARTAATPAASPDRLGAGRRLPPAPLR